MNAISDPQAKPVSPLYHVTPLSPEHKAWGVYRRKRTNKRGFFRLVSVTLAHSSAVDHANAQQLQSPEYEHSVQGEHNAAFFAVQYAP